MPNAKRLVLGLLVLGVVGCTGRGDSERSGVESPPSTIQEASEQMLFLFEALEATKDAQPAEYQLAKTYYTTFVQMTLGQLGFGTGPFTGINDAVTQGAVRRYEEARGIPITGDPLTPLTFENVTEDEKRLINLAATPQPSLSHFFDGLWGDGYFLAEGPWMMEGQGSATHDAIDVNCVRQDGNCTLSYAQLWASGPEFQLPPPASPPQLMAQQQTFAIASWDAAEIVSAPLDTPCTRQVLRINRVAQSVRVTRSTLSQEGACDILQSQEIVSYLATREQAYRERQRAQDEIFSTLYQLSPEAAAVVIPQESVSR